MTRCQRLVSVLAVFVLLAGCANDVSSQQMAAYSVATGFLTLCDDSDFEHALEHFAKPLKASVSGPSWVKNMQGHRSNYGAPIIRALVTREEDGLPDGQRGFRALHQSLRVHEGVSERDRRRVHCAAQSRSFHRVSRRRRVRGKIGRTLKRQQAGCWHLLLQHFRLPPQSLAVQHSWHPTEPQSKPLEHTHCPP